MENRVVYTFADHTLDPQRRELLYQGRRVPVRPQVFDLLVYLITHHDRVVSRQELQTHLWPHLHVSPTTLKTCIKLARLAVGDSGTDQRVIQTLHSRGYRFVAAVQEQDTTPPVALPATRNSPVAETPLSTPPTWALSTKIKAAEPAVPSVHAEYKLVSVLCGAVTDTPTPATALDPEALYRRLQRLWEVVRMVMRQYAGTLLSHTGGESFTAVFGAPVAQEDHARRAVLAALDLRKRWRQLSNQRELALSLGIHSSLVVVGEVGIDPQPPVTVVGAAIHGAMRLQQQAVPGALLVSAVTYHLVQEEVEGEACGHLALDDRQEPLAVYALQGPVRRQAGVLEPSSRPWSPFVGRQRELELLHDRLHTVQSGEGQVVSLLGAPGIGKTRLLIEFGRSLSPQQVTWYSTRCLVYGQVTPYLTMRDFLQQLCAITASAAIAESTAAVRQRLGALGGVPEEEEALLLQLLDLPVERQLLAQLSPEVRYTRTFALLWQLICGEAQRRPLVLAVDNVHWIDATSAAWLAFLAERLANTAVLLLVTARPGTPSPWGAQTAVTQLVLPPLREAESRAVVQAALETAALPVALHAQIVARGAGNPFFLEELARHAVEHRRAATPIRVPETVHAVLAARIDGLPPAAKQLLQTAAVLGLQMTEALLQAVLGWVDVDLRRGLQQLQAAEFLYETRLSTVCTYTFKHALTQEVAYQSLLAHTRQQMHQHIAEVVAERFPDLAAAQPELVAQHYTAAGLPAAALPYWQQAGHLALQHAANLEAIQHLTTALELLATLPDTPARAEQELAFLTTLGPALLVARGQTAPEVAQTYTRALALCQQLGNTPQRFATLWGLQRFYRGQGAFATARVLGEQLVQSATGATDPTQALEAHDALGMTLFFLGDYTTARTHLGQGSAGTVARSQRNGVRRQGEAPEVRGLAFMSWTLWCLGYPEQALQKIQEALVLAQELAHPYNLMGVHAWAADLYHRCRDIAAVQDHVEALLSLATVQGAAFFLGLGSCYQGWGLTRQGQYSAGLALLDQGMAAVAATGHIQSRPRCLLLFAEAAEQASRIEDGLRLLVEARTTLQANGQGELLAETQRLYGALLLHQATADVVQAEACFQEALTIARHQHARAWELRAALNLSRLWQQQGKCQEAYNLLAPIYGWFTEGFGTPDLQDAMVLLRSTYLAARRGSGRTRSSTVVLGMPEP